MPKKEGDTEQKKVYIFGEYLQTITQPVAGFGSINHFKCKQRLSYRISEDIVRSLGGRLLTIQEAKEFVNGQALYPGLYQWCAVKNPEGLQGNDYIQVGNLKDEPGVGYHEKYGNYPEWADKSNQSRDNMIYCANCVLYKVI